MEARQEFLLRFSANLYSEVLNEWIREQGKELKPYHEYVVTKEREVLKTIAAGYETPELSLLDTVTHELTERGRVR